jgi:acrylyl-CoA reductase (NADPH)
MRERFQAYRIYETNGHTSSRVEWLGLDDLSEGEITVRVHYSTINYKDALAATGKGKILRRSPLVGGIDLAGEVIASADPRYRPGQLVLVTGCGLSEVHDGGYAEIARVRSDWVIPLPPGLSVDDAMRIGTAGFSAALAVDRMEANGQHPGQGPIIVTGATGGVGSLAVNMLATRGYQVTALTGNAAAHDYLRSIGAVEILARRDFTFSARPLEKALWSGAIDNLGGDILAELTRRIDYFGNIASIGLVAGAELHTTVMPFILRGVNLLGINSVANSREVRLKIWDRLASDLRPRDLKLICPRSISFSQLPHALSEFLGTERRGRTLVDMRG